ncbi:MAG: alpha/beta hydrolase [Yoonia sp.]|uniref:alpha/beta hydrolase n=1 Tax=Yoonia sp. TaxID=2212373 RepID=UPI003EF9C93D
MRDLTTLAADLAAAEAQVPNLRPDCEKRIVWADQPATKTGISVVFVHGFSASGQELRPLPDMVADSLGANLFFTRLTGHGQDSDAMGRTSLAAWQADVEEALEVGHLLGDQVIVMGCSTGCTLLTLALAQGAKAWAVIYISPNFGLRARPLQAFLDLPGSRKLTKYVTGNLRTLPAKNEAHAAYWTLRYPTEAVHVMADTVRAARAADLSGITTPALFCFNDKDQVVDAEQTRKIIARWGGPSEVIMLQQTKDDDSMGHIMAGDIFSPNQTAPLAARISAWCARLPDD